MSPREITTGRVLQTLWQPVLQFAAAKPRVFAAVWFSVFALIGSTAVFIGHAVLTGVTMLSLYVVLPVASAATVGYFFGASILDPGRTRSYGRAMLRGVCLTLLTFIVFAPFFIILYALMDSNRFPQLSQLLVMLLIFLLVGIPLASPAIITVGVIGATILHAVGRRAFSDRGTLRRD